MQDFKDLFEDNEYVMHEFDVAEITSENSVTRLQHKLAIGTKVVICKQYSKDNDYYRVFTLEGCIERTVKFDNLKPINHKIIFSKGDRVKVMVEMVNRAKKGTILDLLNVSRVATRNNKEVVVYNAIDKKSNYSCEVYGDCLSLFKEEVDVDALYKDIAESCSSCKSPDLSSPEKSFGEFEHPVQIKEIKIENFVAKPKRRLLI